MRRSSSSSHSWQSALQKVFRRRSSESKGKQPALDDDFKIGEHKDGFYKYSQEVLEKKNRKFEPPTMRALDSAEVYDTRAYSTVSSTVRVSRVRGSDSTETSYASAVSGRNILSWQFAKQSEGKETNIESADATQRDPHSSLYHRII